MNVAASPPATDKREKEGLLWLAVVLGGWLTGLIFITGPLGWFFGGRLRRDAKAEGVEPPATVLGAWIAGIVTTAVAAISALLTVALVALWLAGFAVLSGTHDGVFDRLLQSWDRAAADHDAFHRDVKERQQEMREDHRRMRERIEEDRARTRELDPRRRHERRLQELGTDG